MSLSQDDVTGGGQTELDSAMRLQQDDLTGGFITDLQTEEDLRMKDLKTSQSTERENKTTNPLSLLKEDLSQFKEDLMNVFKDKDMKTADHSSSQSTEREYKTTNPLSLFKEDLSQFREDLTSVFSVGFSKEKDTKSADLKTSQAAARELKTTNTLSLLKEDLSQFKEDLTSVFRMGLSKEKDNKAVASKEDFPGNFKIKVLSEEKAERTGRSRRDCSEIELNDLFGRDQTRLSKTRGEKMQESKKSLSEKRKEKMTDDRSNENGETVNAGKMTDDMESAVNPTASELDIKSSGEKTETRTFSETQQSEERILALETDEEKAAASTSESEDCSVSDDSSVVLGELRTEEEDEEEEEEEDENPLMSLASGIGLFVENDSIGDIMRDQPGGELWALKNFACYLTLDPNTANPELLLSDDNRKATRVWSDHRYPEHPERFDGCPQVLCREGLMERFYWEVEWSGGADVGVTYNSISRDGDASGCLLGHNGKSWTLECCEGSYTPCHDNKRFGSSSPRPSARRVGVYLDWAAGSLSFYSVRPDSMTLLHTFSAAFTEPLYPGFWVWGSDASVSLSQVQLDWERLLQ
ncbi:uncharacterized protein LOC139917501 [Centroberyx gerrardi]